MRSINHFCYNFDSPYQFSILLLLNVGKYFHCCVLLLYQAIAPSQAIFFIEFLYLKLTSSIAISFLYPTLSAFSISLSMQKSYFASFEKGLCISSIHNLNWKDFTKKFSSILNFIKVPSRLPCP